MAQWKETPEPYVKVTERVKSATLNPVAGEDLIIGVVIISDAGDSVPTLINGQSEFVKVFASAGVSEDYLKSLDKLYTGADRTLASTMWANAYRLAGSNTLLVCRASKQSGLYFSKALDKDASLGTYVLRDGELLKKCDQPIKFVIDTTGDGADHNRDGWSISISGTGVIGNVVSDQGPQYDYFVSDLGELVKQLNQSGKFFSPSYKFYRDQKATEPELTTNPSEAKAVVFEELYLGTNVLETQDPRCLGGKLYLIVCEPDWTPDNADQKLLDLNAATISGFTAPSWYASNVYNSSSEIKVRIRRFNHDAVVAKSIQSINVSQSAQSPWTVLTGVLDTYTGRGQNTPSSTNLDRDFYEVCILDPSISETPMLFNVGKIPGRGDITVEELNEMLSMISLNLPDNLFDLGINYYGYTKDDNIWVEVPETSSVTNTVTSYSDLLSLTGQSVGDVVKVGTGTFKYYKWTVNGGDQVYADLTISPENYRILDVSDEDLQEAFERIAREESYVVEGISDIGNTNTQFQNYLANLAVNENYFYPISTVPSTNYMTIANASGKILVDSYKLYTSAPWDIDTTTLCWKVAISNSVLYWESVSRNRRNNNEFASVFGQSTGVVSYQKPMVEFNKKIRQLLLTKNINTVIWNNQSSAWNMNDSYTKQSEKNIMSDDGNSRMMIRISKAMPVLLRQYYGWKITPRLWDSAKSTIDYWFKTTILPMNFSVDDYRIIIDESEALQRQNKMKVTIRVRFSRSLKYIDVYEDILDVGMSLDDTVA